LKLKKEYYEEKGKDGASTPLKLKKSFGKDKHL
jgi:hypothetical protein